MYIYKYIDIKKNALYTICFNYIYKCIAILKDMKHKKKKKKNENIS